MQAPLAEAAARLPWLCPAAANLAALTRPADPAVWQQVRRDPACVLLLLRHTPPDRFRPLPAPAAALRAALRRIDAGARGFVDWGCPAVLPVYRQALAVADLAHRLALRSRRCDPDAAWVAGLLAPLGWMAVAAVRAEEVEACLAEDGYDADPVAAQQRRWGLDAAAIARRLARRWNLPSWLRAVAGYLRLPAATAAGLGADPGLFALVQAAAAMAEAHAGPKLGLAAGVDLREALAALGVTREQVRGLEEYLFRRPSASGGGFRWEPPAAVPLLRPLLRLAAENRRLAAAAAARRLQREADYLAGELAGRQAGQEARLRDAKLAALAEFAAGAGHEINNPLAVISGQAQYLLAGEEDPERREALQSVIRQAQRIHQILHELRQFARPAPPKKEPADVRALLREVLARQHDLAAPRNVTVGLADAGDPLPLLADARQVQTALNCLVRNAVEAAPPDGWVRVTLRRAGAMLEVLVEDSGAGPPEGSAEHLFDPFYSGRSAGRGRGLGLPTAWRLARENGGDVTFDPTPAGPTRFVLTLPLAEPPTAAGPEPVAPGAVGVNGDGGHPERLCA